MLDLDFRVAKDRLAPLIPGNWLDTASGDAYAEGAEGLGGRVKVGPFAGAPGMSKLVRVSLLEPVPHDHAVVMPMRWEATGLMGRLFPVLDANLVLSESGDGRAVLRLTGAYRPPFAGVGEELDRIVLNRVATATVKSLLARIADALTGATSGPPPVRAAWPGADQPGHGPAPSV